MSFIRCLTLGFVLSLFMFCFVSPIKAQSQTNKPAESTPDQTKSNTHFI